MLQTFNNNGNFTGFSWIEKYNQNSFEKEITMKTDWPEMVEYLIGHEIKWMNCVHAPVLRSYDLETFCITIQFRFGQKHLTFTAGFIMGASINALVG